MTESIDDCAAVWCHRAGEFVEEGRRALLDFGAQEMQALERLRAVVTEARSNPAAFDKGLLKRGVAAALHTFDNLVLECFSNEHFSGLVRTKQVAQAFAPIPTGSQRSIVSVDALLREYEALTGELRGVVRTAAAKTVEQFRNNIFQDLPTLLKHLVSLRALPLENQESTSALFVPRSKRSGRVKVASWTLGILGFFALIRLPAYATDPGGVVFFWLLFLGALSFFGSSALVTSNAETQEEARILEIKNKIESMDWRVRRLIQQTIINMESRLEAAVTVTEALAHQMLEVAASAIPPHATKSDFVFGECTTSPVVDGLTRMELGRKLLLGNRPSYPPNLFEDYSKIGSCLAFLRLCDCDRLEVLVGTGADSGSVGHALLRSALEATQPGSARFMFIEPGRLAEAYRVFGALNETPGTRLAERLYITHVSELVGAVDALRTFVGRTKEVMTRQSPLSSRIGDRNSEAGAFHLQRAVVVLDQTEQNHWPEKDRRRLLEFYDEIRSLAEVGAREGSVLLIDVKGGFEAPVDLGKTTGGTIRLYATKDVYYLHDTLRVIRQPAPLASETAKTCDEWSSNAKKRASTLRQARATLDWSDTEASDSRYGVEAEIGRYSADRPAKLLLGREGAHHAICIGRTGSGKTNLFHVIVTNLVRRYSPDELELYLLDYKEGVEFSIYADVALPHCRAVAIDADRGFGVSVLAHLRRELNTRANIFKAAGVGITSLERYEEITGKNMPRIVLLIDEFQVLLQGERTPGAATGAAAAALEDLVRRGRSFGLHVILGSQTLAGRELTPATLGQLALRIVLPSSAPDATTLLGDQTISTQLRAPGDAIVWSAGQGTVSDVHLAKIYAANLADLPRLADSSRAHVLASGRVPPAPFVFRGSGQNELAEVMPHLHAAKSESRNPNASFFALGAPTSFGERAVGKLENRRARNVLFVHRADETRAGFLYSALESLLALEPYCTIMLCDLDESKDLSGRSMAERAAEELGSRLRIVQLAELDTLIKQLGDRNATAEGMRAVLAIGGTGRTNLNRSADFSKLLREGPETGLHVIATCDSVRNLERLIERSLLAEFGMRGLGPAAATDSVRLLDANDAEALRAEHQYLLMDDTAVGHLTRLQVLTSSLERGVSGEVTQQEFAHA